MFSIETVIFLLSSSVSLLLVYYKVPTNRLQQIISVLLVVILLLLYRFIFTKIRTALPGWFRPLLLLLASSMVQLVVISSGGFLSPFLILLHLFTLGTGFLLNSPSAVIFLGCSLTVLTASIWLNQNFLTIFKDDPFSTILYFVSLIVIIPLIGVLNRTYRIKDTLSRILSENLHLGQQREESIIKGLNELVLVTDKDLKLLSVNQTVEKTVGLPSGQILGHLLTGILPISSKDGSKATIQTLSIPQMLEDKSARIITDLYLNRPGELPIRINVQIRPIADSTGKINQFVFVLKEKPPDAIYSIVHKDLDLAYKKQQVIFDQFQKMFAQTKINNLRFQAEILRKIEGDLLIAQEIEDHPVKENIALTDVAEVCKRVLTRNQEFAQSINVNIQFKVPPEELQEISFLNLKDQNVAEGVLLELTEFRVPIDPVWLEIIVEKLLDIAILIVSGRRERVVELLVSRQEDKQVAVEITTSYPAIPVKLQGQLLTQYFGELGTTTNLQLGSGLEGFIVQTIVKQLQLSLFVKTKPLPSRLAFLLELSKGRTATGSG